MITPSHTAEFIASLIRMSGATHLLEIGMYTGYGTLHMIRAIWGKGRVVSVDCSPVHDREFFASLAPYFEFVEGTTPDCLRLLHGQVFDLVFVDSDHSLNHTKAELSALMPITRPGSIILFHDAHTGSDVYDWLKSIGAIVLPTLPGDDGATANLGIFIRPQQ